MPDILPAKSPRAWVIPAAAATIVVLLWGAGSIILDSRPDDALPVSRIAIGKTDDGAALRVLFEGCDVTSVTRVTVKDEEGGVAWEVRGASPPGRTNFVIGQSADPMAVTQSLQDPLSPGATYRVEVEADRLESLSFDLRSVPPVGVLHEGVETTTEGFRAAVDRRYCQGSNRLPFAGSILAQALLIVAGAAFAVVAAGLLGRGD